MHGFAVIPGIILSISNFPLHIYNTVDIIKNAIGAASSSGRYFKFSSVSDENLLVPLPARPSESVPTMHFFMMRLIRNGMWEALVSIFYYSLSSKYLPEIMSS